MRKLVLAGILAGLSTGQLAHALSLELSPTTQTRFVGQSLAYDLWVKDVRPEIVSAFAVDIAYRPSILTVSSVTFGTGLNGGDPANSSQFSLENAGSLNVSEVSLLDDAQLYLAQPVADFVLFTLACTGLAEGLTDLTITSNGMAGHSVEIAPCNPGACKFNPVSLNPTLVSASARIEPIPSPGVPEPSILALAGLGLLGLLSTRRGAAGTALGAPGHDRMGEARRLASKEFPARIVGPKTALQSRPDGL